MNLYVIVEGARTEPALYRAWLPYLLPGARSVDTVEALDDRNFYVVAGYGYPSILSRIEAAVADIREQADRIGYLVVALDAEDETIAQRHQVVLAALAGAGPCPVPVHIVVADCCIETWLLGNRKLVRPNPHSDALRKLVAWYDVRQLDPEALPARDRDRNRADTHLRYLRAAFAEKQIRYAKNNPGPAADPTYLAELQKRLDETGHISSFAALSDLAETIGW